MKVASVIISDFFEKVKHILVEDEFFFYVLPVLTTQQRNVGYLINLNKLVTLMCEVENVFPITSSEKFAGKVFKSDIQKSLRELPLSRWSFSSGKWTSRMETNPAFLDKYFVRKERSPKRVTFMVFGTGSVTITSPHESMVGDEVKNFFSSLERHRSEVEI